MYKNLYSELKERKITQTELAKLLNITGRGLNLKMLGKSEFKSGEMFKIRETYFPDLTLEYLFKK